MKPGTDVMCCDPGEKWQTGFVAAAGIWEQSWVSWMCWEVLNCKIGVML